MKKRLVGLLLFICMLVAFMPYVSAAEIVASGNMGYSDDVTWALDDEGLLTISGKGQMSSYAEFSYKPWDSYRESITAVFISPGITSIGNSVFVGCYNLTEMSIPDSVISIGELAFLDCTKLTHITIPSSVTSIGRRAFNRCSHLAEITIPSSVASIGERAFQGCMDLTDITIPNSVTSIGEQAFYDCTKLTHITIPESVASIGLRAFGNCSSLTNINVDANNQNFSSLNGILFDKSQSEIVFYPPGKTEDTYSIPEGVTSIGKQAFYRCYQLADITIPNSVASIDYGAFEDCNFTSITIPDSVTYIGSYAFEDTGLTSIRIPENVVSVGQGAFNRCTSLKSVFIENGVTSIDGSAFNDCTALTTVVIPKSVTFIGDWAFSMCYYLKNVYYSGTEAEWNNISISERGNSYLTDATIHYNAIGANPPRITNTPDVTYEMGYIHSI